MSIKRTLLALALVAFAAACGDKPSAGDPAPAPAPAQAAAKGPGLWRIGDADTTIYLFGTVHVLPPDLNWRTTAVDKALGNAKAVYFET
ncbi:MAG TPA: TraB/GumN family protein, partial [Hyphomonadaceae bacterium]|nr:TraB/GumN family protein [Hyphomonadaceae bacterium]